MRTPSTLRRLLGLAEKEIARLETRRDELSGEMAAAGADYTAVARLGSELADVADQLASAEHRWLTLAEELEA